MKNICLLLAVAAGVALAASGTVAQEVLSRNVTGYHTIMIQPGLNLLAFPFQKIPVARGVILTNDAATITVGGETWWDLDNYGQDESGTSTFYVEITSGDHEGRHLFIDSNVDNQLMIVDGLGDIDLLAGEGYKIIAANRVRDLFGEPGAPLLQGYPSSSGADTLRLWKGTTWGSAIFYQTEDPTWGTPVNAWKQGAAVVNDKVIGRDDAVFVLRVSDVPAAITVTGEISPNDQQIVLREGLNLVGGVSVLHEIIGQSTLIANNTLAGSPSSAAADTIRAWAGTTWDGAVFFQTSDPLTGQPVNEWKRTSQIVTDTFAFSPIRGYFINVQQAERVNPLWLRPAPPTLTD